MKAVLNQVTIETTNLCNGSCLFCVRRLSHRPIVHMDLTLCDKLISEIAELSKQRSMRATGMCGIGECTLHPQFTDMLQIIRRVPFTFGTNCHGMTDEQIDAVLAARPSGTSSLSIDATTPDVLAQIRPGLKFDKVVDNVQRFVDALRADGSYTNNEFCIQMVVCKLNAHQVQDHVDYWLPRIEGVKGVFLWIKWVNAWPRIPESATFYPTPMFKLSVAAKAHAQVKVAADLGKPAMLREGCTMPWRFAGIKSNGVYVPCCLPADDEFNIGNVQHASILQLFHSPKMDKLRALMTSKQFGKIPYCSDCR